MCRSANYQSQSRVHHHEHADPLTITGFYVRLCASGFKSDDDELASKPCPIPDSLTLLLFPPLTNCCNINNNNNIISKVPQFSPVTVSLRKIELPTDRDMIVFGSKQRVRAATQVLSFQLYVGEAQIVKGAIRNHQSSLKLELCKSEVIPRSFSMSDVELWVSLDGHVVVGDKVTMEKAMPLSFGVGEYKKMRNNKHGTHKSMLENIPEEREFDADADAGGDDDDDVGGDSSQEIAEASIHLEMDLEVLRKAMDMGIWVLCLGLGLMVSKAS